MKSNQPPHLREQEKQQNPLNCAKKPVSKQEKKILALSLLHMPSLPQFREKVHWESLPRLRLLHHPGNSIDVVQLNSHVSEGQGLGKWQLELPKGLYSCVSITTAVWSSSSLVNDHVLVLQVALQLHTDSIYISCEFSVFRPRIESQFPHLLASLCY